MNVENVRKLIQALRSGEFKQVCGTFRGQRRNEHCVLGLAAHLSDYRFERGSGIYDHIGAWLGIPLGISGDISEKSMMALQFRNDGRQSFAQIADVLERWVAEESPFSKEPSYYDEGLFAKWIEALTEEEVTCD